MMSNLSWNISEFVIIENESKSVKLCQLMSKQLWSYDRVSISFNSVKVFIWRYLRKSATVQLFLMIVYATALQLRTIKVNIFVCY